MKTLYRTAIYLVGVQLIVLNGLVQVRATDEVSVYSKWSTIELDFEGPVSNARGNPNPFDVLVDLRFKAPSGREFLVPGFYDGDGAGDEQGDVWRVRFSADEVGNWSWTSRSKNHQLNGLSGQFAVVPTTRALRFRKWGRLEHDGGSGNGSRYLKFRDGPRWLKAGCDDPENFLGNYSHFDTLEKRLAAVEYLASRGVNSLYIMTHNLSGDDNDVWPWIGNTPAEAMANSKTSARFNLQKLRDWRRLFEAMQIEGVVPYVILEDDSAWKEYDHNRYFREIIARFGDLPALMFNLGEEHNENYSLSESLALAKRFKELDPYDHPLGIHNVNKVNGAYVDSADMDFTSIQTGQPGTRNGIAHAIEHNQIALDWIGQCQNGNRRSLMINFDEGRPELDRRAWWSAYLAGGVWEAHVVPPYDQPLSAWDVTWRQLGGARAFMESMPFAEMAPQNDLIESGSAFCLAKGGEVYAAYLPAGGSIDIKLESGTNYTAAWWNPENDFYGRFQDRRVVPGGVQSFTAPSASDWALKIVAVVDQVGTADGGYFPPSDIEGGWRRPASVDEARSVTRIDVKKLDEAFQFVQGSTKNGGLLVLKDGWLVYEDYFGRGHRTATPNLASCGKSFTSIAVGILLREKAALFPEGLDQKVFSSTFFPEESFPLPDPSMADIRLGQLLTFTAGIRGNNPAYVDGQPVTIDPLGPDGWQGLVDSIVLGQRDDLYRGQRITTKSLWCEPGGGYSYATAAIHRASIMVRFLAGVEMAIYLDQHLTEPLGWSEWGFGYRNSEQVTHTPGGGGIAMRGTDMLRFGYLLLNEGKWRDRQLVPAEYIRHASRRSRFNPHYPYSLQFTVNTDGHFPDLPKDAFWKAGSGGHALYMVPSRKLVVWKLGGRDSQYSPSNTGLPATRASAQQIAARDDWRPSVDADAALSKTLKLVIESLLD